MAPAAVVGECGDLLLYSILTLHVPTSPNEIVKSDLGAPPQPDPFEAVPFRGRQLLPARKEEIVQSESITISISSVSSWAV